MAPRTAPPPRGREQDRLTDDEADRRRFNSWPVDQLVKQLNGVDGGMPGEVPDLHAARTTKLSCRAAATTPCSERCYAAPVSCSLLARLGHLPMNCLTRDPLTFNVRRIPGVLWTASPPYPQPVL